MMLNYFKLKTWEPPDVRHTYTEKDTMLYALALGFGDRPNDERQLSFVYERNLRALPTMASVLGTPGFWMRDHPEFGIDYLKLVHGEQNIVVHRPLPPKGTVLGRTRVKHVVDKGKEKGAVLHIERQVLDGDTQAPLVTVEQVLFCRGDGGFSSAGVGGDTLPSHRAWEANGAPHGSVAITIPPSTALLYRLSGDRNPLHADPEVARQAGFERPILHGLATYGIAFRSLISELCEYEPDRVSAFGARLSAPVFPGEEMVLSFWIDGDTVRFVAEVPQRGVRAISNGTAKIALR